MCSTNLDALPPTPLPLQAFLAEAAEILAAGCPPAAEDGASSPPRCTMPSTFRRGAHSRLTIASPEPRRSNSARRGRCRSTAWRGRLAHRSGSDEIRSVPTNPVGTCRRMRELRRVCAIPGSGPFGPKRTSRIGDPSIRSTRTTTGLGPPRRANNPFRYRSTRSTPASGASPPGSGSRSVAGARLSHESGVRHCTAPLRQVKIRRRRLNHNGDEAGCVCVSALP